MRYQQNRRFITLLLKGSLTRIYAMAILLVMAATACAEEVLVAVATNFKEVAERLAADFERSGTHEMKITSGSTGKLYAQVLNGAPYDVLLAADQERPRLLEESGHAVAGTRFVYATGRLTLWSPAVDRVATDGRLSLEQGRFDHLAMANPDLAPYGLAAKETLQSLGLWDTLSDRIVMGENIGQTHMLVSTKNANLGFVAISQVLSPRNKQVGSRWDVPANLHSPIRQEAVMLVHGAGNVAAREFLEYMQGETARSTLESFGYASE
jgi:molybdate transport system substrate-binding protein